jgi:hypothetical protein
MSEINIEGYWTTVRHDRVSEKRPWSLTFDVEGLSNYISDPSKCGFVHFYDAAYVDPSLPFLPIDWGLPALLQANIRKGSTFDWLASADQDDFGCPREIADALATLPTDVTLLDCEQMVSLEPDIAAAVAAMCAVPGVKVSIATKMLHKKRPHLIPVMDTVVHRFIVGRLPATPETAARAICGKFRELLIREQGGITALRDSISERMVRRFRGRRLGPWTQLTPPRLLDICIWVATERTKELVAGRALLKNVVS